MSENQPSTETQNLTMDIQKNPSTENTNEEGLNLQLLLNIRNILDVAVNRGAFRPNELSSVGSLYDKFSSCLDKLVEQSKGVQ